MDVWSNIKVSSTDAEIGKINEFEARLGKLPDKVYKIRELITGFEVCHFKYPVHIKKIKDSILNFEPITTLDKIGITHIRHGEKAWEKDSTGKSIAGQQYVWAIKVWLGDISPEEIPGDYDIKFGLNIQKKLGNKNEDKVRLVRLLLARLTWNWKSYEEFQHGEKYNELKFQICRMDICHYAFPANLDRVLKGIGEMKPVENFEGCGSFNGDIREFIERELLVLNGLFKTFYIGDKSDENNRVKAWLTTCLIKTLKEQVEISEPSIEL